MLPTPFHLCAMTEEKINKIPSDSSFLTRTLCFASGYSYLSQTPLLKTGDKGELENVSMWPFLKQALAPAQRLETAQPVP